MKWAMDRSTGPRMLKTLHLFTFNLCAHLSRLLMTLSMICWSVIASKFVVVCKEGLLRKSIREVVDIEVIEI